VDKGSRDLYTTDLVGAWNPEPQQKPPRNPQITREAPLGHLPGTAADSQLADSTMCASRHTNAKPGYDYYGYNKAGYDKYGYDKYGYSKAGVHRFSGNAATSQKP